jgi:hypothetical protein
VVSRVQWVLAVTVWGALGSVLDSILGGLLQASVVDKRSGKIVEGTGGGKVCFIRWFHARSAGCLMRDAGPRPSILRSAWQHGAGG